MKVTKTGIFGVKVDPSLVQKRQSGNTRVRLQDRRPVARQLNDGDVPGLWFERDNDGAALVVRASALGLDGMGAT